jgi:hypothetical protein
MAQLQAQRCPQCGGQLEADGDHPPKKCPFCGTLLAPSVRARPQAASSGGTSRGLLGGVTVGVLALLALGAAGVAAGVLLLAPGRPVPPSPPVEVPVVEVAPPEPPAPAPPAPPSLEMAGPLFLSDIDGDGAQDAVVGLRSSEGMVYAAFEGRSGREIGRTPALQDARALVAVKGPFLVSATEAGQVTSHDLRSGHEQWTTLLGERALGLCESGSTLLVLAEEERRLELDLVTGRQVESRATCDRKPAGRHHDPRDRRDPRAPAGVEAYVCGGVRVMGDDNYTVPDACVERAKLDPKRMDGLDPSAAWKVGDDWLVLGSRTPGARVPMVGRARRGTVMWKSELPAQDPAAAKPGAPEHVVLAGEQVVAAYEGGGGWLTALAVDGGARRWTAQAPGPVEGLAASPDRIFVLTTETGGALLLLDPQTGAEIGRAGSVAL